jgi:transposase-like protein
MTQKRHYGSPQQMIAAVRRGQSMRSVARRWGVSLSLVQYWMRRTESEST